MTTHPPEAASCAAPSLSEPKVPAIMCSFQACCNASGGCGAAPDSVAPTRGYRTPQTRMSTAMPLHRDPVTESPSASNAGSELLGKSASFFPVSSTALFGLPLPAKGFGQLQGPFCLGIPALGCV